MPEPLTNATIAQAFEELGDLYELDGADRYRVIAYRNAARAIRDASVSVAELTRQGKATSLAGIGRTLESKLNALVEDGVMTQTVKLREKFPPGLLRVMQLPGFGPKRARQLFDELGVDSLETLKVAAESGRIRDLRGFGAKAEENLKTILAAAPEGGAEPRVVLPRALRLAEDVTAAMRAVDGVDKVEIAGSARRLGDSVKDVDVIVTAPDPETVSAPLVEITATAGIGIDLQVVEPDQFGNVLQHLTGSKAHNVQLREAAVRKGLHVSQYGILDDATGETYRCATEEEVYERLGYTWIPPELREGRGELEAARLDGGTGLPDLVTVEDLKGDLHCHTTASDGRNSLEEMAAMAIERGYEYLAITDHSASHGFGNHVTPDHLRRQIEAVRTLDAELDDLQLLIGTEANILPDGSLDYDDDLLAELDWTIGSVHTAFTIGSKQMTARMMAACEHPYVDAIGHATGRKIEARMPYAVDVHAVIEKAAETGTMLEINSAPDRRDLDDVHARAAAEAGVMILIDSDAHGTETLQHVRWGVATARRAWLTPAQIANTRPWAEFAPLRKRART